METTTIDVIGMTCGGCAGAVRTAVVAVDGVTEVDVNIVTGVVTVRSTHDVRAAVTAAVADAGYRVTS